MRTPRRRSHSSGPLSCKRPHAGACKQRGRTMVLSRFTPVIPSRPWRRAVAVGTIITDRPRTDPDGRHYRIRLLPWISGVESHCQIRMHQPGAGQPAFQQSSHPLRAPPPRLAAPRQRMRPVPAQPFAKSVPARPVPRHRIARISALRAHSITPLLRRRPCRWLLSVSGRASFRRMRGQVDSCPARKKDSPPPAPA